MKEEREITFLSLILSMSFLDHVALFTPLIYKFVLHQICFTKTVLFTGVKPLMLRNIFKKLEFIQYYIDVETSVFITRFEFVQTVKIHLSFNENQTTDNSKIFFLHLNILFLVYV